MSAKIFMASPNNEIRFASFDAIRYCPIVVSPDFDDVCQPCWADEEE